MSDSLVNTLHIAIIPPPGLSLLSPSCSPNQLVEPLLSIFTLFSLV